MASLRFAYADPPYIGQAKKHYSRDPRCAEVDHVELIRRLSSKFDGWALSCKSDARELAYLISQCKQPVRLGAWVKPFCIFKPGVNPAYAWEPVIFYSPRKRTRAQPTARDWISANVTLRRGLTGVKPDAFCSWLFEALNIQAGDRFSDLYPGSGAVRRAWRKYRKGLEVER
jgi:hypothetical protein